MIKSMLRWIFRAVETISKIPVQAEVYDGKKRRISKC